MLLCYCIDTSKLEVSHTLESGQKLISQNGNYVLNMQRDGNLVVYYKKATSGWGPLWSSKTAGKGSSPYKLRLQSDNHLVIYDNSPAAIWSTSVFIGKDGQQWEKAGFAVMQNDGNFVVYDGNNAIMWETATDGGTTGIYGSGRKHEKGTY